MINRKSRDEIKRMRHAGHIVALVHKKMKEVIEPGISTKELNSIAMNIIKENKVGLFFTTTPKFQKNVNILVTFCQYPKT